MVRGVMPGRASSAGSTSVSTGSLASIADTAASFARARGSDEFIMVIGGSSELERPAGVDDLAAVDLHGAAAHRDVEVVVGVAVHERMGSGREEEVAGQSASVHAHEGL